MPVQSRWDNFIETFFRADLIEEYYYSIWEGVQVTCIIAVLVVFTGIILINFIIVIFVDLTRALPPLVLILLSFFGLPTIGINLSSFLVLWLVLSIVLAAFSEEIFWAGILSIRKGQWEAARSTGLGYTQTLIYVISPQAVRMTVAPITNRTIAITKNTALGMVIGVAEILGQASTAQSFSGNATPLMMGAIAYVMLFVPVVILGRWIETRFSWSRM